MKVRNCMDGTKKKPMQESLICNIFKVSFLGVGTLWGYFRDIPTDQGS